MVNGYNVEIMPSADEDLHIIYNYIEQDLGSRDNAEHTLNYIKEKIIGLESVPKGGILFKHEPWKTRGLRMVNVKNYTIFYFVYDEEETVKVVKVAYSKMDFDKLLKKLDNT